MPQQLSITGMELGPWTAVTGTNIAPCPPDAYEAVQLADGTRFYAIKSTPYPPGVEPYAGVLWNQTHEFLPSGPFTTLRKWTETLDDAYLALGNVVETDGLYAISNGDVANESFQLNLMTGTAQIVNAAGAWVDVGRIPILGADVPFQCSVSSLIDPMKETTSVQTITVGSVTFVVPATLQSVPFFKLGWMPPAGKWTATWQNQIGMGPKGGAMSRKVTNMSLAVTQ